jgi:hypothetical protein
VVVGLCTGCCQRADSWKHDGAQKLTSSEEHLGGEVVSGGGCSGGSCSKWLVGRVDFFSWVTFGLEVALANLSLQLAIDAKS